LPEKPPKLFVTHQAPTGRQPGTSQSLLTPWLRCATATTTTPPWRLLQASGTKQPLGAEFSESGFRDLVVGGHGGPVLSARAGAR